MGSPFENDHSRNFSVIFRIQCIFQGPIHDVFLVFGLFFSCLRGFLYSVPPQADAKSSSFLPSKVWPREKIPSFFVNRLVLL